MARAAKDKAYRTFINGFITEATGLTFPENSCRDIDNCDIELKGTVRRRLGLNEEAGGYSIGTGFLVDVTSPLSAGPFSTLPAPSEAFAQKEELAVTVHVWPHPGGQTDLNFVVFQVGNYLFVRDWDNDPVSSPGAIFDHVVSGSQIQLDGPTTGIVYNASRNTSARTPIQSASGFGRLWLTSPYLLPFYLEYDPATKMISARPVGYDASNPNYLSGRLAIRDFAGVNDGLTTDNQPATLTTEHKYNLYNQGWSNSYINSYFSNRSRYPANSQQWILGKDSNDDFDPGLLAKQDFGNSQAPRGRGVMHALTGDRDTVFGGINFSDAQDQKATHSFASCAFFAGRVWLSGDVNPKRPNGVYFSKTLQKVQDAGVLMQENDPTSEHFSDLLDTDGGVIYITEASAIKKLVPFASGLLVMAENGVWFIAGTSNGGFTATGFSVEKVSATGIMAAGSVVATDQQVAFFAENSIHVLALPGSGTTPGVLDIGQGKVFSYYGLINREARLRAQGAFDPISKKVFWSWLEKDEYNYPVDNSRYNRMLILDTRTGAFTKYSFTGSEVAFFGNGPAFPKRNITRPQSLANIIVEGSGGVTHTTDGDVVGFEDADTTDQFINSVLVTAIVGSESALRVMEFYDTNFRDYRTMPSIGVQDYTSFVVTGDEILEDLQRDKQATFLHSFFQRTETGFDIDSLGNLVAKNRSGCTVVARWDWHNTQAGGRWSDAQRAYRFRRPYQPTDLTDTFDTGEEIVYTKLKIRGKGRALTLRYESVSEQDFQLLGFSTAYTATGV